MWARTATSPSAARPAIDTINATGSTLGITAFGEEGNDTITGGGGQDSLFGDFGRVDFVDAEGEIITRLGHSIPLNPVNPPVVSRDARHHHRSDRQLHHRIRRLVG
jgi:hypothetical protein